ncbi:G5 domain-containing protein [Kribbella sp. NPDC004536]|uniref:G5 domain-containing protein n=1 Tax=Kribbella sp. NPDC004536 TaxID=3364106 RepID=UPI0036B7133D
MLAVLPRGEPTVGLGGWIVLLVRVVVGSVAVVLLAAGCGADGSRSAVGESAGPVSTRVAVSSPVSSAPPSGTPSVSAGPGTRSTQTEPVARSTPTKRITTTEVVEFRVIPFKKRTVTDDSVTKGEKRVRTAGVNGARRLTYRVTYVDGVQTAKRLVRQEVVKEPRTQVTVVGTKVDEPAQSNDCDPNYSGCVPIASDVDCAGGSGNGPEYVQGPIEVIGTDIYRLDADHDGIACE